MQCPTCNMGHINIHYHPSASSSGHMLCHAAVGHDAPPRSCPFRQRWPRAECRWCSSAASGRRRGSPALRSQQRSSANKMQRTSSRYCETQRKVEAERSLLPGPSTSVSSGLAQPRSAQPGECLVDHLFAAFPWHVHCLPTAVCKTFAHHSDSVPRFAQVCQGNQPGCGHPGERGRERTG